MRKLLLVFGLLLTAHCSPLTALAQDKISRVGASVAVNTDGSVTITLKDGKTLKLVPQASLPGSCVDGQFTFRTNVGLHQCVNGSWLQVATSAASQPLDSDLTAIAAIAPSNDDVIQRKSNVWINRSPAQLKTDLVLGKGDVGLGSVDNTSDAGKPVSSAQQAALDLKANLASPTFTGAPTLPTGTIATTQSAADNTTKVATTAFVTTADNLKANIASPTFTGTPAAPTAAANTNTTQVATTAFVQTAKRSYPSVALTDASTIATDASLGNYFRVTLGGNRTLGNPTNASDGQRIVFEIIQDGTGTRTLAYDTKFAFGTDITGATLTTTVSKRDFLTVIYNSTADKFYVVGFVKGY